MSAVGHLGPCSLCAGVLPDGEWCRACGYKHPGGRKPVEPMTGLPLAIRLAKGACLSTDSREQREAFHAACVERAQREGEQR